MAAGTFANFLPDTTFLCLAHLLVPMTLGLAGAFPRTVSQASVLSALSSPPLKVACASHQPQGPTLHALHCNP